MRRLATGRQCARAGSLVARKRRARIPRAGYLANPASLIGIPRLEPVHSGGKLSSGSAALTALAQTFVEIDLADESDWIAVEKIPSLLVERVIGRYLAERGQAMIADHFELSLTLGESIVNSMYLEPGPALDGQLFFVLNPESCFPLAVGNAITELEAAQAGMGQAFYATLREALWRWVRVYDEWDARERIEQLIELAEGEDDPDSYEIPKLDQDLPACLKNMKRWESGRPLVSFSAPSDKRLKEMVETTIELHCVSHSVERPMLDQEFLDRERQYHSLDSPVPAVLLYFRPSDAVTACFDDECEFWAQETPEPNLIIPVRPHDAASVRQALAVVDALMRVLFLTVRIEQLVEPAKKSAASDAECAEREGFGLDQRYGR